jgi:four helix bundle protein
MGRAHGLRVWYAAREYVDDVNATVAKLPRASPAGLRGQLVTSARSVSNCIAEGAGRGVRGEKLHYFRIARGSVEESQDQLRELVNGKLLGRRDFYRLWNRAAAIDRMLAVLIDGLERGDEG